jgi:hypothetical protein
MIRPLFVLALYASANVASAQGGATGTIVLEHPASARALALGAMTAVDDGDAALFTNPALLDARHCSRASVSGQRYLAGSNLAAASVSAAVLGGTVGFGLRGLNYGSVSEYVPDTLNYGGQRGIATGRDVSASEFVATMGYGRRLGRLQVGGAGSYVRQQIADAGGATASFDIGVAMPTRHGIVLGAAIQHLGPDLDLASTASRLPLAISAGASWPARWRSLGALVAVDATAPRTGDAIPRAGAEVWWRTANGVTIVGRASVRGGSNDDVLSRFTYGAGFGAAHLTLEYARQGVATLGTATHRVGVRYQP